MSVSDFARPVVGLRAILARAPRAGWPGRDLSSLVADSGAVQPFSRAICRPSSEAGPAAGPSSARSSGKPASTRSASRQVQMRGPRVERTSLPARRSSTSWVADSGVWLSMNSQLTIITGA